MSTGFSRTSSIRVLAVLLLGVVIAGCLDRVVTGPEQGVASLAAKLVLVTGNSQTGPVNRALTTPVKLKVTDANGGIVKGGTVAFSVRKGGGTVTPASAVSGDDGTVSATWTLGTTLGAQQVVATLTGDFVVDSASLSATATNGPASKLSIDVGDGQKAVIGTQLPVAAGALVTDDYGYAVAGADVTFRVVTGGGRIELVRTTTDSTGRMSARWFLGTVAGQQTISATLATGATVTFKATADAGLPSTVIQESGSGQTGTVGRTLASPVAIRVVDGYGNNVRGVSVTWTAEDGSIAATSASTDTLGRSLARWTLGNRTGTQNASASVAGATPVTMVAIAQPGTVSTITLETGNGQTQTVRQTLPLPLVARVTDSFGNGVSGVGVTWAAASGGGSLLATSASSDASGRATSVWTLGPTAGSQLATLAVTGLPLTVYTATALAASGDSLLIEAGNSQTGTVGTALGTPLIVRVRDTLGNPVVGTTVIFAVASGGGVVTPALAVTDVNGRAQAAWTLGSFAGPQTVSATVGSKSVTFTATGAAVGGGGGGGGGTLTPSQLVLVSGNGQTGSVGQTLGSPIVVQVIDASGIPVTGVNVTWTLAAGNSGGFASPSVSRSDASGNANLLWTLGSKVGLQQVTVSATGVPSLTLQATAQIGSAGALVIDNGNGQTGAIGAALTTYLRVLVVDQSGTPVTGGRVNWAVATGVGTLSKASGTTNAAGLDSVAWTLGTTAGAQTVTATVTGLSAVTFTATAGGSISIDNGNNQSGTVNSALTSFFRVKVVGPTGTAIPGVTVNWAVLTGNGTISKAVGITNASGLDSARLTLGPTTGTNTVTATVTGLGLVTFSATSSTVASTPASIVKISGDGQTARSGQTLTSPLVVEVRDAAGSPLASVAVTLTAFNGGFVSPTPVLTGVDGRVSASWTLSTNSDTTVRTDSVSVVAGTLTAVKFYSTVRPAYRARWIRGGISAANPVQSDTTGATLADTLIVQVYDPTGAQFLGVGGQTVTWMTVSGTAIDGVSANSVVATDNSGYAKNLWLLRDPTSGIGVNPSPIAKRMKATAVGVGEVEFRASVSPGRPVTPGGTNYDSLLVSLDSVVVGKPISATFFSRDQALNGRSGDTLTFVSASGALSATGLSATGGTSVTWNVGTTLGTQSVTVRAISRTVSNLAGNVPVVTRDSVARSRNFKTIADVPATITKTTGDGQTATAGTSVPLPLAVQVFDQYGNTVAGTTVTFTVLGIVPTGGSAGTVSSATVTTDSNGRASVAWTLGTPAGANSVAARAGGITVIFTATGT